MDWLFEKVNVDHSILIKYVRSQDQLADFFDKRKVHHNAVEFIVDFVEEMSAAFLENLSLAQLRKAPTDVSVTRYGVNTHQKY